MLTSGTVKKHMRSFGLSQEDAQMQNSRRRSIKRKPASPSSTENGL